MFAIANHDILRNFVELLIIALSFTLMIFVLIFRNGEIDIYEGKEFLHSRHLCIDEGNIFREVISFFRLGGRFRSLFPDCNTRLVFQK